MAAHVLLQGVRGEKERLFCSFKGSSGNSKYPRTQFLRLLSKNGYKSFIKNKPKTKNQNCFLGPGVYAAPQTGRQAGQGSEGLRGTSSQRLSPNLTARPAALGLTVQCA